MTYTNTGKKTLAITLNQSSAGLQIKMRNKVIDSKSFSYYHDLDRKLTPLQAAYLKKHGYIRRGETRVYKELVTGLITNLDRLLKRNRIGVDSIKGHKILGKIGREATSHKIAEAITQGLKIKL